MRINLSALVGLALLGCGDILEKQEPSQDEEAENQETEDLSIYCGEDPDNNLIAEDNDCDGTIASEDCDDNDPESTIKANDQDCDSINTQYDCDDNDPESTIIANDQDCDGILTINDCDDFDPSSTIIAEDADCDGAITSEDCDDYDPNLITTANDSDCDGVLTIDDCNDSDPSDTLFAGDCDQDGVPSTDDCDDHDPLDIAFIGDCDQDGVYSFEDCSDQSDHIGADIDADYAFIYDDFLFQGSYTTEDAPYMGNIERWFYNEDDILFRYDQELEHVYGGEHSVLMLRDPADSSLLYARQRGDHGGDNYLLTYEYDVDENMLSFSQNGHCTSSGDYIITKNFTYNSDDNVTNIYHHISNDGTNNTEINFSYTYDSNQNLVSLSRHEEHDSAGYYEILDTCYFDGSGADNRLVIDGFFNGGMLPDCPLPEQEFVYPDLSYCWGAQYDHDISQATYFDMECPE